MKRRDFLRLGCAVPALAVAGCSNIAKQMTKLAPLSIIQEVFDSTLPRDFVGPWYGRRANAAFDVVIDAGNVRFNKEIDQWTFDWLIFEDKLHIGTWNSGGKLVLGNPPVVPGR